MEGTFQITKRPMKATAFKGLKRKDKKGKEVPLTDLEYMELLGRRCLEMDKQNTSRLPTDYGDYNRDVVTIAKQIVEAIDKKENTREEAAAFLKMCIDTQA